MSRRAFCTISKRLNEGTVWMMLRNAAKSRINGLHGFDGEPEREQGQKREVGTKVLDGTGKGHEAKIIREVLLRRGHL